MDKIHLTVTYTLLCCRRKLACPSGKTAPALKKQQEMMTFLEPVHASLDTLAQEGSKEGTSNTSTALVDQPKATKYHSIHTPLASCSTQHSPSQGEELKH